MPLYGHQQTAPWLDESILDGGLYIEFRHPRVIRNPGPFDVSVLVNNLLGDGDVVINQVRYVLPGSEVVSHPRDDVLFSKSAAYLEYKAIQGLLPDVSEQGRSASVEMLSLRSHELLLDIARGSFSDRQNVPAASIPEAIGSTLDLSVEIDVLQAGQRRTIQRVIEIPVQSPLPDGPQGLWRGGDQHLHTAFSIDARLLEGTREGILSYAVTARMLDLDWIITTDHTNSSLGYSEQDFDVGEILARVTRNRGNYLALQGQEMGVGSRGPLQLPSHLLAYPRTADSTGFLINTCTGLLGTNCEPEQVVIDRVNNAGGIGFIAHPSVLQIVLAPWDKDNGATGWAGLEIFSDSKGELDSADQRAIDWWYELLNEIPSPQNGELEIRPDFPTRFPVGLGNSDAHKIDDIGATFTYVNLNTAPPEGSMVSRDQLMDAFVNGRVVASNGPLVFGEINGAGIGEVAILSEQANQLAVTLQTSPEFGPVGLYEVTVLVDGSPRTTVDLDGPDFESTIILEDLLGPPDKFVTIQVADVETSGVPPYQAITNPIWLEWELESP